MTYKLSHELTDTEFHRVYDRGGIDRIKEAVLMVPPKLREQLGVTKELLVLARTNPGTTYEYPASRPNKTLLIEWASTLTTINSTAL